eukprot:751897-Hanusia_phi.AAC.6
MEHELEEDCLGHYGFCPDSSRKSRIRKTMMPNQVPPTAMSCCVVDVMPENQGPGRRCLEKQPCKL